MKGRRREKEVQRKTSTGGLNREISAMRKSGVCVIRDRNANQEGPLTVLKTVIVEVKQVLVMSMLKLEQKRGNTESLVEQVILHQRWKKKLNHFTRAKGKDQICLKTEG
jgi:hypothetical protein